MTTPGYANGQWDQQNWGYISQQKKATKMLTDGILVKHESGDQHITFCRYQMSQNIAIEKMYR